MTGADVGALDTHLSAAVQPGAAGSVEVESLVKREIGLRGLLDGAALKA